METRQRPGEGVCPHGKTADYCSACKATTHLGVRREDLSQGTQRMRGKANVKYEKSGERLFAKYVTRKATGLDNIAGLAREARLLQRLENTGIVPRVQDFKVYPSGQKARLILEELPGTSLDHMALRARDAFIKEHAQDIVQSTAAALARVNDAGVHVVDINDGTFLFDQTKNNEMTVRILDLELGYDEHDGTGEELTRAVKFAQRQEPTFCSDDPQTALPISLTSLRQAEMYKWAHALANHLIRRMPDSIAIPPVRKMFLRALSLHIGHAAPKVAKTRTSHA